jgi:hypothetical protein
VQQILPPVLDDELWDENSYLSFRVVSFDFQKVDEPTEHIAKRRWK